MKQVIFHTLIVIDVLIACGIVVLVARYAESRERRRRENMKKEVIVRKKPNV